MCITAKSSCNILSVRHAALCSIYQVSAAPLMLL